MPHIKTYALYDDETTHNNNRSSSSTSSNSSGSGSGSGGIKKMKWCLLTSANMSLAAWGQLQENKGGNGPTIKILSYELGILFFDDDDDDCDDSTSSNGAAGGLVKSGIRDEQSLLLRQATNKRQQDNSYAASSSSSYRTIPLPYDLPPSPYCLNDGPWVCDKCYQTPVSVCVSSITLSLLFFSSSRDISAEVHIYIQKGIFILVCGFKEYALFLLLFSFFFLVSIYNCKCTLNTVSPLLQTYVYTNI
jgi:hypothetical protein